MDDTILNFNYPTDTPKIIKVIGVGGGGGNAVTHMYKEGIHDVTFVLCNTDNQALNRSDVPIKLLLGREITQGLGAGNKPERAMMAAEESGRSSRYVERRYEDGIYYRRYGWWYRYGCRSGYRSYRKGYGNIDGRYRNHSFLVRG